MQQIIQKLAPGTTNAVFNRFNTQIGFDPFPKEGGQQKRKKIHRTTNAEQDPTTKKYQGFSFSAFLLLKDKKRGKCDRSLERILLFFKKVRTLKAHITSIQNARYISYEREIKNVFFESGGKRYQSHGEANNKRSPAEKRNTSQGLEMSP